MGLRSFTPLVSSCPGCGRTSSNFFQVLAQEIQEQFPDLVVERQDGMLTVNYQGLIPVLINAIKEQNLELENAKKANHELEARIARLEKLMSNK